MRSSAVSLSAAVVSVSALSTRNATSNPQHANTSGWENLLGAVDIELRAQRDRPVPEDPPPATTACGAPLHLNDGDHHHPPASGDCSGELIADTTDSQGVSGGGTASRSSSDDVACLLVDMPQVLLSRAAPAVSTPADVASTAPQRPIDVVSMPVSTPALDSTTSPLPLPVACGTAAIASLDVPEVDGFIDVEAVDENRNHTAKAVQAVDGRQPTAQVAPARVQPSTRRGPPGQSRFKGVCITRAGTWRAVIYNGRKQKYLGVFDSEFDAARAYDAAALQLFAEGAKLNNPDDVERQLNEISAADGKPIATAGAPAWQGGDYSCQAWGAEVRR